VLDKAVAATQYGDLSGSIVLDGYTHSFLHALGKKAGIPPGHFAVGLELSALEPGKTHQHISVRILAVEMSRVGADGDAIKAFAEGHRAVPVKPFEIDVPVAEVIPLIKRCSIVISDRLLGGKPMTVEERR
jgi:hypothetical protein